MTTSTLDQRYGTPAARRHLPRRLLILLIVLALGLASAFVAWIAHSRGASPSAEETGYTVESPLRTTLEFDVTRRAGDPVVCAVQALNDQRAVVGWREVRVAPDTGGGTGRATVAQSVDLWTTARANTATVDSCWVADAA